MERVWRFGPSQRKGRWGLLKPSALTSLLTATCGAITKTISSVKYMQKFYIYNIDLDCFFLVLFSIIHNEIKYPLHVLLFSISLRSKGWKWCFCSSGWWSGAEAYSNENISQRLSYILPDDWTTARESEPRANRTVKRNILIWMFITPTVYHSAFDSWILYARKSFITYHFIHCILFTRNSKRMQKKNYERNKTLWDVQLIKCI